MFRAACAHDLEGIVAKWRHATYQTNGTVKFWLKIKNTRYTQIDNRHELFDRRTIEGAQRPSALHVPVLELR